MTARPPIQVRCRLCGRLVVAGRPADPPVLGMCRRCGRNLDRARLLARRRAEEDALRRREELGRQNKDLLESGFSPEEVYPGDAFAGFREEEK